MLAISSDLDNTSSLKVYLEMMKFFNTKSTTSFGRGLDLEIGNSFWFFNNSNFSQLSYYKNLTCKKAPFAYLCSDLLESGHIDVLHTYGNFDNGGFLRKHAEIALNELTKKNIKISVWVDHGSKNNTQRVGNNNNMLGAVKGSNEYHLDMAEKIGLEY